MPDQWIYEPVISDFDMRLLYQALLQYKGSYFYYPIAVAKRKESVINTISYVLQNKKLVR